MSITRKFEFHFPIWDKEIITYADDKPFWNRFQYRNRIYMKTFQCLVEVRKISIKNYMEIKHTLDWLGPIELRVPVRNYKMIKSDYAASNGGKRYVG